MLDEQEIKQVRAKRKKRAKDKKQQGNKLLIFGKKSTTNAEGISQMSLEEETYQ